MLRTCIYFDASHLEALDWKAAAHQLLSELADLHGLRIHLSIPHKKRKELQQFIINEQKTMLINQKCAEIHSAEYEALHVVAALIISRYI